MGRKGEEENRSCHRGGTAARAATSSRRVSWTVECHKGRHKSLQRRCLSDMSRACHGHMPRARSRSAVSREALDRKCLGDVSCRALDHSLPHDTRLFTPRGVNTLPAHSATAEASRRNATSARATRKVPTEELSEKVHGCVAAWSERLLERLGGAGRRQLVVV